VSGEPGEEKAVSSKGQLAGLLLLVAYCLDLAWKLANWNDFVKGLSWEILAISLTIRVAFMGGILYLLLWSRKKARQERLEERAGKSD
jgi:hypothetical protein